MKANDKTYNGPNIFNRVYSVWYRHMRVYTKNLISNGIPPFLEPLLFLAGIGIGLGKYISQMDGVPYLLFLSSGLLVTSSMYTASFECTYGTFIRMEFDKVYDGILGAPISVYNLIVGEVIWAGTKGFFFSFAVLCVVWIFGIVRYPLSILAPLVGFLTGLTFSVVSLLVTSFVKNINHFNFFFTGFLSPMFFFSGVVFPVENLPLFTRPIVEIVPLTHCVRLVRALCIEGMWSAGILWDLLYIILFISVIGYFATMRLKKRMLK